MRWSRRVRTLATVGVLPVGLGLAAGPAGHSAAAPPAGPSAATLVLTRVAGAPTALIGQPV